MAVSGDDSLYASADAVIRYLEQFDAVFHLDETSAVEPLGLPEYWQHTEASDTYPFGV